MDDEYAAGTRFVPEVNGDYLILTIEDIHSEVTVFTFIHIRGSYIPTFYIFAVPKNMDMRSLDPIYKQAPVLGQTDRRER